MSAKKVLLAQFDLHNLLYNNVTKDITDAEASKSISSPMNNFKWLAGHMLSAQNHFANLGGVAITVPWQDHFPGGPGAPKSTEHSPMPSLQQIIAKWNELHPQIRKGLENLPEEALAQPVQFQHPIFQFDNTLGGLWAFLNHHQAYTIGQLGVLRRGHNKEAMKYN